MTNTYRIQLAGILALALAAGINQAKADPLDPINGSIAFDGTITTDTGDLGTATAITGFENVTVNDGSQTGNYAGLDGSSATFSPFSFSSTSVTPLWELTVAGVTYEFDASSIVVEYQVDTPTGEFLSIGGTGSAYIGTLSGGVLTNTFAPTEGIWSITDTTTSGAIFTFGSSTTVPDTGSTALLLALGVLGIAIGARTRFGRFARA